jgi:hypothetical protein
MDGVLVGWLAQCCESEIIFVGSGSHFPPSFGSGSYLNSFGSDPKHSLFHNANDFKWLYYRYRFESKFFQENVRLIRYIFNVIITGIKLLIFLMIFSKI